MVKTTGSRKGSGGLTHTHATTIKCSNHSGMAVMNTAMSSTLELLAYTHTNRSIQRLVQMYCKTLPFCQHFPCRGDFIHNSYLFLAHTRAKCREKRTSRDVCATAAIAGNRRATYAYKVLKQHLQVMADTAGGSEFTYAHITVLSCTLVNF